MCTSFATVDRAVLADHFQSPLFDLAPYRSEIYPEYLAPMIRNSADGRETVLANFGMVPQGHQPAGKRYATMNVRSESISVKPTYARFWKAGNVGLIPMRWWWEPCWETGRAVRWRIGLRDAAPFAVACLWRSWEEADSNMSITMSLITINADDDPILGRMHKPPAPGEPSDKRSLVIIPASHYDDWLQCRDPERARTYLTLYPTEAMAAQADPLKRRTEP